MSGERQFDGLRFRMGAVAGCAGAGHDGDKAVDGRSADRHLSRDFRWSHRGSGQAWAARHQADAFQRYDPPWASVTIPSDLKPGELDWRASRTLQPWYVRRGADKLAGHWYLEWIELSRSDVTNTLCTASAMDRSTPATPRRAGTKARSRPALEGAQRAVQSVYPDGVPDKTIERNKILCGRVGDWLKTNSFPDISDDTILRAAGRRK